ncbi:MAG: class I SAM-dependent methyltransferase [Bosea sp. (in: a-proteobacteria)]
MTSPVFSLEEVHDLLRGIAAYHGSPLVADIANSVAAYPEAPFPAAFNPKQVASKAWALNALYESLGGEFNQITVLGGWIGILSAMLLNDPRFTLGSVDSLDLDPSCASVAQRLNQRFADQGRFKALTGDMYAHQWPAGVDLGQDLVVNTSAEHIPDPGLWAAGLPRGINVLVQSNNYRVMPEHISCVDSAAELSALLGLSKVVFAGEFVQRRYTRFMVIGQR